MEAERIFKALAENGTVQMPLQETFWAFVLAFSLTNLAFHGSSTAGSRPDGSERCVALRSQGPGG